MKITFRWSLAAVLMLAGHTNSVAIETYSETNAESLSSTDSEAQTHTFTIAETETWTIADAAVKSETESDAMAETGTESQTESESKSPINVIDNSRGGGGPAGGCPGSPAPQ